MAEQEFYVFIVWLLVIIVVFFLARNYGVSWWSSIVLALFIGLLLLIACGAGIWLNWGCDEDEYSRSRYKHRKNEGFSVRSLLYLLGLISVIVVIVYIIQKVFEDRCDYVDECEVSE